MGLFDWIDYETVCPKCGAKVDGFQSKDGPCRLLKLKPSQVGNYYAACLKCNHWLEYDNPNPPEPIVWCQSGGIIEEENTHVAVERNELEALRADARRYRWLKEVGEFRFRPGRGKQESASQFSCKVLFTPPVGKLDDAIDVGLSKEGE